MIFSLESGNEILVPDAQKYGALVTTEFGPYFLIHSKLQRTHRVLGRCCCVKKTRMAEIPLYRLLFRATCSTARLEFSDDPACRARSAAQKIKRKVAPCLSVTSSRDLHESRLLPRHSLCASRERWRTPRASFQNLGNNAFCVLKDCSRRSEPTSLQSTL